MLVPARITFFASRHKTCMNFTERICSVPNPLLWKYSVHLHTLYNSDPLNHAQAFTSTVTQTAYAAHCIMHSQGLVIP